MPGAEGKSTDHPPEADNPGADDPNLEYARKATNMALEHLEHEAGKKDSRLLKDLGWTKDEAERFAQPPREDPVGSGDRAAAGCRQERSRWPAEEPRPAAPWCADRRGSNKDRQPR